MNRVEMAFCPTLVSVSAVQKSPHAQPNQQSSYVQAL
jgi:hypothetical protein